MNKGNLAVDIVYQIQFLQGTFSRQEKKVGKVILENPAFASAATLEQLAARAGVSTATVAIFAKSLGCQDINDFMTHMRAQHSPPASNTLVSKPVPGGTDIAFASATSLGKLPGVSAEMMRRFAKSIGYEDIGDIIYQIRAQQNQLSQQESKVAQAILDDVAFASSATIEQLASQAGVSPATITRFAKSMGCDDIRDLRMKLAQASAVGSQYMAAQPVKSAASGSESWQQNINQRQQQANRQLAAFDEQAFLQAAATISAAIKGVYIFSAESRCTLFASELQSRLLRAGHPAYAFHDAELMRLSATVLTAQQAVLILSVGTENQGLAEIARLAVSSGAQVIAIVPENSPAAARASTLLAIEESPQQAFGSSGMLMAIDLLLEKL
ncbi:MurR/RpiR family transcriptional regulator [Serratia sp. M24T3]|uniref:MurR/RpiR family transcriptional regulator n=1 Tax=Serratia sp. M24T3 TaxID=932213 RepID=UPI00025BAE4B|nr:MurR/RpiR family transcriptional regulator [Serratia sp. M24T3]EIC83241.1 RpiR family transcriptional regulator [Serratia sp. M24T3]